MKVELGHTFLARVGKKRLRPGGKKATKFLLKHAAISDKSNVLEVACNMGTTLVPLVKKTNCQAVGVDLDKAALLKAEELAKKKKVTNNLTFLEADATKLPFPDNTFDVVINEAMLTMQQETGLKACLEEYARVLKPGGLLLTHDVKLTAKATKDTIIDLRKAINVGATPKTILGWTEAFNNNGFKVINSLDGPMTLMRPSGMIQDEGILRTIKIFIKAQQKANKPMFKKIYTMFKRREDELGYIALVSINTK